MSSDVLAPPADTPSQALSLSTPDSTDTESPASAPPTSTSFTFAHGAAPPPVPPKPSSISLTVASAWQPQPSSHARSQSTSTGAAFLRLGSGKQQKSPMSLYAAEGSGGEDPPANGDQGKSPRPEPAAKPSWLKRTTSGSKAIASSMGLDGGAATGRTATPPLLPPRDRARAGSSLARDAETLAPPASDLPTRQSTSTPPDLAGPSVHTSPDDRLVPLPPPPQRANPPILPPRGRSEDLPRAPSAPPPGLGLAPRGTGSGFASRINAWTSEAAASSAGRNATGLLKAAPGAIGSAVQSGWGQFRNGRSAPPAGTTANGSNGIGTSSSSTSGLSTFGKSSLASSSSQLDADAGLNERDGPHLAPASIRRPRRIGRKRAVFGVEPVQSAAEFPAVQDVAFPGKDAPREVKRKASLPAIALRCVDYLEIWAPKEEGIFRISGRSTHINVLRKYFDEGADLELVNCDPGDIDPHAIASMYKAYLRELPGPILTPELSPRFDDLLHRHLNSRATERDFGAGGMGGMATLHVGQVGGPGAGPSSDGSTTLLSELKALLDQLPAAHWWMLADLACLLGNTSKHSDTNKMTLANLLMVLCPSLSLTPTFLRQLVDHHSRLFTSEPLAPQTTTADALPLPLLNGIPSERPNAIREPPKFSTPIADRFARTGPIELSLRDKPSTA